MSNNNNIIVEQVINNPGREMWITLQGNRSYKTSDAHFVDDSNETISFIDIKGNEITCHISQILGVQIIAEESS